jgi:hypothetical protein
MYYKVLSEDRIAYYSQVQWPEIGESIEVTGDLEVCENGIHLCKAEDLFAWLDCGYAIYEAEPIGDIIESDEKICCRGAKLVKKLNWSEKRARLYAADVAEHVLNIFEREQTDDDRPRKCIEAARLFANGEITKEELDAAGEAAGEAAWAAAWAAWAAAWAAWAAGEAARDAWDAERQWQLDLLMKYLYEEVQ